MKRKIIIDFDDVIVNILQTTIDLYNKKENKNITVDDFKSWNTDEVDVNFKKYLYKIDYINMLDKRGAIEVIRELCNDDRYEVYIATAGDIRVLEQKQNWIKMNMPFFNINHFIFCRDKSILRGFAIVDDAYHNLYSSNIKHKIIYDMPHNKKSTQYDRIYGLCGIIPKLNKWIEMYGGDYE